MEALPITLRSSKMRALVYLGPPLIITLLMFIGLYAGVSMWPRAPVLVPICLFCACMNGWMTYSIAYRVFRSDSLTISKDGLSVTLMGDSCHLAWSDISRIGYAGGGILTPPATLLLLNIKNPLPPRFLIKRDPNRLALHNLWKWRGWYNTLALGKLLQECVTKFGHNSPPRSIHNGESETASVA